MAKLTDLKDIRERRENIRFFFIMLAIVVIMILLVVGLALWFQKKYDLDVSTVNERLVNPVSAQRQDFI